MTRSGPLLTAVLLLLLLLPPLPASLLPLLLPPQPASLLLRLPASLLLLLLPLPLPLPLLLSPPLPLLPPPPLLLPLPLLLPPPLPPRSPSPLRPPLLLPPPLRLPLPHTRSRGKRGSRTRSCVSSWPRPSALRSRRLPQAATTTFAPSIDREKESASSRRSRGRGGQVPVRKVHKLSPRLVCGRR